jgi:hypothetical protein
MTQPKIGLYVLSPFAFVFAIAYRNVPFALFSIAMAAFSFLAIRYDERRLAQRERTSETNDDSG